MKNIKGNLLIVITLSITFALWFFAVPREALVPLDRVRHILAGLALNGFFLNFLLATRNKTIENWFNGLNNVYVYHKYIAFFSLGALAVHAGLGELLKTDATETISQALGSLGLFLFIALAGMALFSKKLEYENWRISHRLMVIPYIVGLIHTYISSKYNLFQLSALSSWVAITAMIGLASAIYVIFFYQKVGFNHKGTITKVTRLNSTIVEWEITLDQPLTYTRGQYIFVKVFQQGIEEAPHPFSISGGDGKKIYLTTKASGDFTKQVYDLLAVNTKVALDGPFGNLDFSRGKQNQVWIAGGIGITPFMAYLRDNQISQNVEMFYSYQGETGEVYKDFLEEYQKNNKNFKVNIIDTSVMKFLDFEGYVLKDDSSIFMCGPEKMINNYVNYFKRNYSNPDLSYEAFKFR